MPTQINIWSCQNNKHGRNKEISATPGEYRIELFARVVAHLIKTPDHPFKSQSYFPLGKYRSTNQARIQGGGGGGGKGAFPPFSERD